MSLPAGFVLEDDAGVDSGLPPGFVLDRRGETPQAPQEAAAPSFYDQLRSAGSNALDTVAEFAAGGNKAVLGTADFFGPGAVNAVSTVANYAGIGNGAQIPTFSQMGESLTMGPMAPGLGKDVVNALGGTSIAAAGMMPVARAVGTVGSTVADLAGFGSTQTPASIASLAKSAPAILDTKLSLLRDTGDTSTAGKMLDAAGNVVNDPAAKAATKQGFDPGLVAMVKASTPDARKKMLSMLDIVEKGKQNFRYSADNRPLDIAGDSVLNRVKVVREANRVAGVKLEGVANNLKGQQVDVAPAVNSFLSDLEGMGVKFNPQDRTLSFMGSDLEGVPGPQRVIKNVVNRMLNTQVPDAYDAHRLKKFIDEQVTYGKNARGLGGKVEGILKSLRRNVDGVLDTTFPEYNNVNTQYSETIGALDSLQDVAGKKMDFYGDNADKAIGTLTRRLLSNAQSRIPLKDAIEQLDTVARKFSKPGTDVVPYRAVVKRSGVTPEMLDDDIMGQVLFTDELDRAFGPASRTSLLGDVSKGVDTAISAAAGQKTIPGMIADTGKWAYDKSRGINEANALKAMRELLQRGGK